MALNLDNLDAETRIRMLEEFDSDVRDGTLYISNYLSEEGAQRYPTLLRLAIESGSDETLADALGAPGILATHHPRRRPKSGGFTMARVPHTAATTLAESEFNRFYLRGLAARVLDEGGEKIEIYRARSSWSPRAASVAMLGGRLDARALLTDLRTNKGVDTALGLPPGPNSGLSGRMLPD